ncbi:MAG: hypothetical protein AAGA77_23970 [Bacteroidota bacterium]
MQKNIIKFLAFFLAIICIIFFYKKIQGNYNNIPVEIEHEVVYESALPDDFYPFYDQYHTDSLFQLERTVFPLKGLTRSSDSTKVAEEIMWQKKDWILHRPFDHQNGTFERNFTNFGGIISEHISANQGLFTLEKRYAKLNDQWHLIFYQELLMNG